MDNGMLRSSPFDEVPAPPNQLRWQPLPVESRPTDFIQGLTTMAGNGDSHTHTGVGIHIYVANRSMEDRFFNADGEMLIVPQLGRLRLRTEMGILDTAPGEIAVIQRGIKFRVELLDASARGYICENYGQLFRLPDLGPIGANGLANPRDFRDAGRGLRGSLGQIRDSGEISGAAVARDDGSFAAGRGRLARNYAPYKYDLARFQCINTSASITRSFDLHVLTSPSELPGHANVDFAIFPPRWLVAEHTFPPAVVPPQFHERVHGADSGEYDAKAEGFVPGGASLHNCMAGHGPDAATFEKAERQS
jgi:homogentisate 1,2-dioxygenase